MKIPLRSPYGLIQEDLVPNRWLILVSCILLNLTNRKQVETILPEFMERWPNAVSFLEADLTEVEDLLQPLGLSNRRASTLKRMTERYLEGDWDDARQLSGIGEYGGAAYDIFCRGIIPEECPKDGALTLYWRWIKEQDQW